MVNRRREDAGSQAGNEPCQRAFIPYLSPCVQFYKADRVREDTVTAGWLSCGCLAGDLSEEWIQKGLLFVEAQFRDIRWSCYLCEKCQAPAVPGCGK